MPKMTVRILHATQALVGRPVVILATKKEVGKVLEVHGEQVVVEIDEDVFNEITKEEVSSMSYTIKN